MARVRIYQLSAHAKSQEAARALVSRVTRQIEFRAKISASLGPYATGRLAHSISREVTNVPNGVRGRVGSPLRYAASAQDGAEAHIILPHRPPWALRFFWRKVGHVVMFKKVNHPGQPGKHYLTEPLKEIARLNGMRYVVYDR
jgi:hypothetical protein